jgi:hypothetical protein
MIVVAHVAGVPVEELLPTIGGPAGMLVLARAWLWMHLRRLRRRDD